MPLGWRLYDYVLGDTDCTVSVSPFAVYIYMCVRKYIYTHIIYIMYNICHVFTYIHIEYMISTQVSIHDVLSQYDTYVYITWIYIYIIRIHIMFSCTVYPKRQCLQQLIPSSFRGMALALWPWPGHHGPTRLTSFCCHR